MDRSPLREGEPSADQFYTLANAPEIVRVKVKSLLDHRRLLDHDRRTAARRRDSCVACSAGPRVVPGHDVDLLVATILAVFVLATLKSIADVTQVAQLGRYYLPVFVLALPTAVAGLIDLAGESCGSSVGRSPWLAARLVLFVWADPTWAYDAAGWSSPFSFTGLRSAGRASGSRRTPTSSARRPDHDLVPLGVAGGQRPDHRPVAAQLQPAADRRGDPAVQGDPRALGLVRAAAGRRSGGLGPLSRAGPTASD